jgi:hypothetical protein
VRFFRPTILIQFRYKQFKTTNNMKINYKGNYEQVKLAVEDANEILYSREFYELINQRENFNCTEKTPQEISKILQETDLEIEVKTYKPKWRYSKVLGYFVKSKPKNVFLNSRKLYRETSSITNTIVHEYVHAVDNHFENTAIDFGHNCGTFKNTAPYTIGNIAEIMIDGNNLIDIDSRLEQFDELETIQCLAGSSTNGFSFSDEQELIIEESRID